MKKGKYNRIKGALSDAGVTNKELAAYLEVNTNTVSRYCTNSMQPPLEMLYKIAEYLHIDVRDLLVQNKLPAASVRKV